MKALLAFWLLVNRDAPDWGMVHRFVQKALVVMKTAEAEYGTGVETVGVGGTTL